VHPSCQTLGPKSVNTKPATSYVEKASPRGSLSEGTLVLSPPLGLKSRSARAVRASPAGAPLALCSERPNPSRARSVPLVKQGIQNRASVCAPSFWQEKVPPAALRERSRSCIFRSTSTAAVRKHVSQSVPLQRSWWRQPRPNPSVEGTAKRLRLLSAPHLQR
jgi:hypothetical protein